MHNLFFLFIWLLSRIFNSFRWPKMELFDHLNITVLDSDNTIHSKISSWKIPLLKRPKIPSFEKATNPFVWKCQKSLRWKIPSLRRTKISSLRDPFMKNPFIEKVFIEKFLHWESLHWEIPSLRKPSLRNPFIKNSFIEEAFIEKSLHWENPFFAKFEADWLKQRHRQLILMDEKQLNAMCHG